MGLGSCAVGWSSGGDGMEMKVGGLRGWSLRPHGSCLGSCFSAGCLTQRESPCMSPSCPRLRHTKRAICSCVCRQPDSQDCLESRTASNTHPPVSDPQVFCFCVGKSWEAATREDPQIGNRNQCNSCTPYEELLGVIEGSGGPYLSCRGLFISA